jgi:peptidoglycan/xylan/chitin deacetylase (PgdA/CDA1 family)
MRRNQRVTTVAAASVLAIAGPLWWSALAHPTGSPVGGGTDADRRVAITIDDLPYAGGPDSLPEMRDVTDALLGVLQAHQVPASGFVIGSRVLVAHQMAARLDLLRRWTRAGMRIENHSFSHESVNAVSPRWYCDDVVRGELVVHLVEPGDSATFFRPPFNNTGTDSTTRAAVQRCLGDRGYRLAPFTVEASDYLYNTIYRDALLHGDTSMADRAAQAYLENTSQSMAFFETLARETFGRPIPQILLIHANTLNAARLDDVLTMLERRGYVYVSLAQATSDASYATPDGYYGTYGPSWLHRWRMGLGLSDRRRNEPRVPDWALHRYRELQNGGP